ncbi:MAG: hypothetical protein E6K66_08630, partial [Nitrospirae bacterium]
VTSTYNAGTGVWSASGAIADVNALLAGVTFNPALNFNSNFTIATSISDGVAPAITGVKAMTGTPVNDAPTATNLSAAETYTEDTALNLIDIVASDVDSANITATLTLSNVAAGSLTTATSGAVTSTYNAGTGVWSASGAIADVNALLAGVTFNPALNFNSNFTIATSIGDGVAPAITGVKAMTGTPVNDAPTATITPLTYSATEQISLTLHGTGLSVADIDAGAASVTSTVSVTSGTISVAAGTTGVTVAGSGTATVTLTGTLTQINNLLAGNLSGTLTYLNSSDTPSPSATLTLSVNDGGNTGTGGALVGSDTATINLTAVDDAPVNTVPGAQVVNEDTSLVFSSGNGNLIVISDVDAGGSSVQVTLTGTNGTVTLAGTGGLTFSVGDGTADATMTFTGTVANINTALAGMNFAPIANFNGAASLQIVTNDQGNTGSGGPLSDTDTVNITVNPVNDAPVNTVPGAQVVNEDTALAVGGISVTDVDGNLSTVQLAVANGTVTVTLSGTATISAGGNGTNSLTLSGSQVDINATLASLAYQGTLNYNGPDTLTVTSRDSNAVTDVDTVAITVLAVDSVPSFATNAGSTVVQGLSDLITSGELQVTDADNTPAQLIYTVTTAPLNGRLELTTAPGVAITSFTQADINAGRLVFVHSGAVSTKDSFTFTVSDGAGGTIGATTFNFTVTPFAPTPPPPTPPPGPGPVPVPVPFLIPIPGPPGPPHDGIVPPLLPPPVLVGVGGATDEPARQKALLARTFARVEHQDIVPQEPLALPLEPLSLPVKTMLAMGHKLAEHLTRLADNLERAMQEHEQQSHLFGRVASFSGITLSVGFVAWILRGGSLLASFLVSMPAWRHFDPLPVLNSGGRDRRKHDRKAREEHEQENKQFRGLDKVLKPTGKPAKQEETVDMKRPKS